MYQRLKDMKLMQKDPNASDKARKAEQRANEKSGLFSIKLDKNDGGVKKGGFKKGGFKSAFAPANTAMSLEKKNETSKASTSEVITEKVTENESDDDVGYEHYDPRKPTGCAGDCGFKGSE
jgi:hypothetical protein